MLTDSKRYPDFYPDRISLFCLSSQLLGGSGLRLTFEHRSRALLCLIHIADSATLEALSHTPRDKVKYVPKQYVSLNTLQMLDTLNICANIYTI